MLRKILSFVLLMSLAFAGVSCSDSDDSSEGGNGGNGAGDGNGGGGASSSYAGWWYYNDGNLTRNLVLLSEDGSVLRAGTLDSSNGEVDGVEFSGDELLTAKANCSYKNESARAYLKKFADSGLSKLSYWCTVDSTQPFSWGIECFKAYLEREKNSEIGIDNYAVEKKPDGSYNVSVMLKSSSFSCWFMIDDTLRGYRGSYATVKPEVDYISTSVDSYYRDTLFTVYEPNTNQPKYASEWASSYDVNNFYNGALENRKCTFGISSGKLGTGTAILKLTYSHPKASKDLIVWIEFKNATSSQQ